MPAKRKDYFQYGELSKIAESAGVSSSYLSDLFSRRRGCSVDTAKKIALGIMLVTNKVVAWPELVNSKYSRHQIYRCPPKLKGWRSDYVK